MNLNASLIVEMPGGGQLTLATAEEVDLWRTVAKRYVEDFGLTKVSDLGLLDGILIQRLAQYRASRKLADDTKAGEAQNTIMRASDEIRKMEKALGVDKVSREAGGQHTITDYVTRLKRAGHAKGIHIAERVKKYEAVMMEARWKIRVLRNGDEEDRGYHGITERGIVDWLEQQLVELEEADKLWAREKGAVFVGKL